MQSKFQSTICFKSIQQWYQNSCYFAHAQFSSCHMKILSPGLSIIFLQCSLLFPGSFGPSFRSATTESGKISDNLLQKFQFKTYFYEISGWSFLVLSLCGNQKGIHPQLWICVLCWSPRDSSFWGSFSSLSQFLYFQRISMFLSTNSHNFRPKKTNNVFKNICKFLFLLILPEKYI